MGAANPNTCSLPQLVFTKHALHTRTRRWLSTLRGCRPAGGSLGAAGESEQPVQLAVAASSTVGREKQRCVRARKPRRRHPLVYRCYDAAQALWPQVTRNTAYTLLPSGMHFCPYDRDFSGLPWPRAKHREWKVYVLVDPRDDTVRYVGITRDPDKRRRSHKGPGSTNQRMAEWKVELAKAGKSPLMAVVDSSTADYRLTKEALWIRYYRAQGFRLLNQNANRRRLVLRMTGARSLAGGTLGSLAAEQRQGSGS